MSIQRAEELKRQWTDKNVQVQSGVPELRRFEGLVGTVKTVNMNCRLLIEFDTPADISWYDIDPQYVNVVTPKEASPANDPKTVNDADSPGPQASKKQTPPSATVTGSSPLDQIRAQAGESSADTKNSSAPAASPLDQIRAAAAGDKVTSTKAAANPLDQIRQQATASPAGEGSATPKPSNPLDAIRQQHAAGSTSDPGASPSGAKPELTNNDSGTASEAAAPASTSGMSPLDQIRASSGGSSSAATQGDDESPEAEKGQETDTTPDGGSSPADSPSAEKSGEEEIAASAPTPLMISPTPIDVGEVSASDRNPIKQVSDQAGVASVDSQYEQVRNQAAADSASDQSAATTDPTGDSSESADSLGDELKQQTLFAEPVSEGAAENSDVAGIEDPVKATFRGKKLPKQDDLKIVEGIGPKIEGLFNDDGITTWKQLADADPARLKQILEDAGPRYRMHNPETWPKQAKLADEGKWQELEEYQDHLHGGRDPDAD